MFSNKTDLESERQVSTAEGKKLAERLNCLFFEIRYEKQAKVFWPETEFFFLVKPNFTTGKTAI